MKALTDLLPNIGLEDSHFTEIRMSIPTTYYLKVSSGMSFKPLFTLGPASFPFSFPSGVGKEEKKRKKKLQ